MLPRTLEGIKADFGQTLEALQGSQYVMMMSLLKCSIEAARVIGATAQEQDGIKKISCSLNIIQDALGFHTLLHFRSLEKRCELL